MARSASRSCALGRAALVAWAFVTIVVVGPQFKPLSGQEPRESLGALLDGAGFAKIPAGEFLMGSTGGTASEQPVHRVRVSRGFEIGKFEVTQAQWEAVMATAHPSTVPEKGAKPAPTSELNPSHFKGPTLPVESVSWADAQRFLTKLNARDTKYVYRLPTEAEWEYVAQAGRTHDAVADLEVGWFESNSDAQTHPIGQKRPNAWGLYDTQGNVSEWVDDWFALDYYEESPAADPPGPPSGSYRVYRGCSWLHAASDCRSATRLFNFPNDGYYNVGFRLVRTER